MTGILAEVSSPALEDDLVVFNEEEYFNYVVQCLDYGDPLTARETAEELSIMVRTTLDKQNSRTFQGLFKDKNLFSRTEFYSQNQKSPISPSSFSFLKHSTESSTTLK